MFKRGCRDWPLESGGCRPEDNRRPGAHHRPRGKGGALPGRVFLMRNPTTPLGSGGFGAGGPTVRKAEFPSGRRMTQQANAGGRKGGRKPGTVVLAPPPEGSRITGRIRAGCPARKGADVGQVSL